MQFNRRVTFILFFIFFLLAAMGIVNTMLMAIIERTRELGMLMSAGNASGSGGRSDRGGVGSVWRQSVWFWEERLGPRFSGICRFMV